MKRKHKTSSFKKTAKTLPALFVAVALVYIALLVKDIDVPTMLPIESVEVVGSLKFVTREKVESIVKNNINGGYFTVDLNNMRESLLQLPWVKDVSLRRRWPASLDVIIAEQIPVAYWNGDGYISDSGKVFKPEKIDKSLNLPELNGPAGYHDSVWKFMNELYQEMALLDVEVVRLDLDDRRSWRLIISEGAHSEKLLATAHLIDVKLGRFETKKRLERFIRILPSLTVENNFSINTLENKNIKVIDMRYPNGFAVQHSDVQRAEA
ncbi:Cell division protein FtsQ [hydrothermal vent metagenome]|uniref:Cell division protein FtsQ n=1 Tax=hydrothermal vent metagenome TaxID=652676 RepID=A0A3B0X6Q5_9ZZZZ